MKYEHLGSACRRDMLRATYQRFISASPSTGDYHRGLKDAWEAYALCCARTLESMQMRATMLGATGHNRWPQKKPRRRERRGEREQ